MGHCSRRCEEVLGVVSTLVLLQARLLLYMQLCPRETESIEGMAERQVPPKVNGGDELVTPKMFNGSTFFFFWATAELLRSSC